MIKTLELPEIRILPLIRESLFPIEGLFREYILILEGIIILLTLQYGIYFFYKFSKEEREKNYMVRAWAIFFITYSGNVSFYIISDFYASIFYIRQIYVDFGYIILGLGALFFAYNAEREMQQKKHIFTIIVSLLLGFLIIDTVIFIITPGILAMLTNIPFLVLLIMYILKFTSKIKDRWRVNIFGFFLGICVWITGYFLVTDLLVELFGPIARFIGDLLIIIGISFISLLFIGLPSLTEFDWPKKMKQLFIMYKSGAYVASYNFQAALTESKEIKDVSKLITGGLTGINQLVTEIVQSKQNLEIIDHKDVKIMFQYGKYLIAAIIVDEVLDIYKTKMKKLIDYLETLYETFLPKWDPKAGDLTQFQIIKPIIKRHFTI